MCRGLAVEISSSREPGFHSEVIIISIALDDYTVVLTFDSSIVITKFDQGGHNIVDVNDILSSSTQDS